MKYALEHNGFHQRETLWRSQKWTMNHKWALNYNKVGNKEMVFSSMSPYGRSLNSLRLSPKWNHTKDRRKEEKKPVNSTEGLFFSINNSFRHMGEEVKLDIPEEHSLQRRMTRNNEEILPQTLKAQVNKEKKIKKLLNFWIIKGNNFPLCFQ